ncbi:MAG: L-threonylcarbamoyladenylate synthase [Candidatus Woesearchaeota archaeon]
MQVITKEEFNLRKEELIDKIRHGSIFIYPTDTIYGLGCNALDEKAVKKIREIKGRPKTPFSVIAPSVDWIKTNIKVDEELFEEWIVKLPGPYTFICNLKNKDVISEYINPGLDTIGIRIPDHWIKDVSRIARIPIVTTSANKVDKDFMTSLDDLDPEIRGDIDFIIYEGEKKGRPSKIVFLDKEHVSIRER